MNVGLKSFVSQGGTSKVFQGKTDDNELVAIKVFEDGIDVHENEAKILNKLKDVPHVL